MSAQKPGSQPPSPSSGALEQAGTIVQRLVIEAQRNVDDVLQRLISDAPAPAAEALTPQAYEGFSTRWSGLADVLVDPRTGLSSRILFWDRVCHAAMRHRRYQTRFALLYIDSGDRDERHVGDIAIRLGQNLRGNDTIAYAGQGEFTILLDQLQDDADALAVAERAREAMVDGRAAGPAATDPPRVGVARFDAKGADPTAILWDAYAAMQQARPGAVAVAGPRVP